MRTLELPPAANHGSSARVLDEIPKRLAKIINTISSRTAN